MALIPSSFDFIYLGADLVSCLLALQLAIDCITRWNPPSYYPTGLRRRRQLLIASFISASSPAAAVLRVCVRLLSIMNVDDGSTVHFSYRLLFGNFFSCSCLLSEEEETAAHLYCGALALPSSHRKIYI